MLPKASPRPSERSKILFIMYQHPVLRILDDNTESRIQISPSRVQGQKDSGSASKNLSIFSP